MIIIIPLHQPLEYPCDYIDQTVKFLTKDNSVILFDYFYPYSWKDMSKLSNIKTLFQSFTNISGSKKIIYFRAPALLPFSRLDIIINLNKKLGFWILSVFLWIFNKKIIVWQFYPLLTKKIYKSHIYLYDCVDYWVSLKNQTKKFIFEEKKLFNISNLVIFNSKELYNKVLRTNPLLKKKSFISVCGCNNSLFNLKVKKIPKELVNITQKKIIFMAVFDNRINVKLLNYVVTNNKNLIFVFIGPIREDVTKEFAQIIREKNVFYLGEKSKYELPPYLKNCNLGIIPYNTKSGFVKYSNPMKAYEYLALGLPVVSTKILALMGYPENIICTTDNEKDFSNAIKRLMNNWNDSKITIAKNIAEKNSWENKITQIEKLLTKYIPVSK